VATAATSVSQASEKATAQRARVAVPHSFSISGSGFRLRTAGPLVAPCPPADPLDAALVDLLKRAVVFVKRVAG